MNKELLFFIIAAHKLIELADLMVQIIVAKQGKHIFRSEPKKLKIVSLLNCKIHGTAVIVYQKYGMNAQDLPIIN